MNGMEFSFNEQKGVGGHKKYRAVLRIGEYFVHFGEYKHRTPEEAKKEAEKVFNELVSIIKSAEKGMEA